MKVKVDRDGCIGCGLCAETCPAVFRMAGDGLSEVYSEPSAANEQDVNKAAEECPVSVIHTEQ